MRNLKKILAMVLALIMSLSLMATAGAGSFQDVTDDNPYKTAIDVLDQLKVFQGFEDGTFKPTDTLNRAQAAVLVYRIATGDVENKYLDNYTFMQQSKFTDLDGYNWAKGYINYCQNAGIVVGTTATTFDPGAKVTGYQLLVMLLRTLGYGKAGEFADPKGWELQTAAIAEREGITKYVTGGDFHSPAPRQMVAEILFRGLLQETVQYSALTPGGYTKSGETLGKRELGLEDIEGVVMANEYASLTSGKTTKDGKTEMLVDGETYTLETTTTLDDIGENRHAYIQNGSKILYMEDVGNTTEESTDAEKVADILDRAGIRDGGVQFVNFDEVKTHDSAYRIKYILECTDAAEATATAAWINAASGITSGDGLATVSGTTVTRIIPRRTTITAVDLYYLELIFSVADLIGNRVKDGEIYVGTQTGTDISDVTSEDFKYSYEKFYDEFIDEKDGEAFTANDNGNWVKVIDNDGDGVAEYIFKVIYTVAQVSNKKDDTVTLDTKNRTLWSGSRACAADALNNLTSQPVIANDEMDKNDIVYYAIIDGKAQTYLTEKVTAAIEKVDHNKLIATTTDGTPYTQSDVHEHIEDEAYISGVRNLAGKITYDLFLDRGGYLAAFVKPEASNLVLITDGWYNQLKNSAEYAIKVYNDETGDIDIVDLTSNGSLFIHPDNALNNGWNGLKFFGGVDEKAGSGYHDGYWKTGMINFVAGAISNGPTYNGELNGDGEVTHTIVASVSEDGTILPVENSSVTGRYQRNVLDLLYTDTQGKDHKAIPGKAAEKATVYATLESSDTKTAYNGGIVENVEVRALNDTVYYVVYKGNVVSRTEGYSKAPKLDDLKDSTNGSWVEDIYAVGTLHEADNNLSNAYYTADVVVVELNYYAHDYEVVFVVDDTARDSDVRYRRVALIHEDGTLEEDVRIDYTGNTQGYSDNADRGKRIQPGFYQMRAAGKDTYTLSQMTIADIRDEGCIAVGQIDLSKDVKDKTYIATHDWNVNTFDRVNDKDGLGNDASDYDAAYVAANTDANEYDITADTKLYKLAYGEWENNASWRNAGYPVVEDTSDALAGRVNEVDNDSRYAGSREDNYKPYANRQDVYFNYNDVMVFYSGDKAVYAVSFENFVGNTDTKDWAQYLWQSIVPAAKEKTGLTVVNEIAHSEVQNADKHDAGSKIYKFDYSDTGYIITVKSTAGTMMGLEYFATYKDGDGNEQKVTGTVNNNTVSFTIPKDITYVTLTGNTPVAWAYTVKDANLDADTEDNAAVTVGDTAVVKDTGAAAEYGDTISVTPAAGYVVDTTATTVKDDGTAITVEWTTDEDGVASFVIPSTVEDGSVITVTPATEGVALTVELRVWADEVDGHKLDNLWAAVTGEWKFADEVKFSISDTNYTYQVVDAEGNNVGNKFAGSEEQTIEATVANGVDLDKNVMIINVIATAGPIKTVSGSKVAEEIRKQLPEPKDPDTVTDEEIGAMGDHVITQEVLDEIGSRVGVTTDEDAKTITLRPEDVKIFESWAAMSAAEKRALNIWWFGEKAVLQAEKAGTELNAWQAMTDYGTNNASSVYASFAKLAIVAVPWTDANGDAQNTMFIVTDKTGDAATTRTLGEWTVDLEPVCDALTNP